MITVTHEGDFERTYRADTWDVSADKTLAVFDGPKLVAQYAPGGWQAVAGISCMIILLSAGDKERGARRG